eukprot:gene18276-20099_t
MSVDIKKRPGINEANGPSHPPAGPPAPQNVITDKTSSITDKTSDIEEDDTKRSLVLLALCFALALALISFVYFRFPEMDRSDREKLRLPKNLDDAKDLGRILSRYNEEYYLQVITAFVIIYVFLQSFAIPGSIFLSILSGYLFPLPLALFLVSFCSSTGASFCYLLSSLIGKKLVKSYFPDRVSTWQKQVDHHRKYVLNYMIFLRITPFLPNWFINITAPVLNVPLWPFFLGTFIGVAPPSFGFISAGVELYELTTTGDAFSFKSISLVIVAAIISLLPVVFRKKLQKKLE